MARLNNKRLFSSHADYDGVHKNDASFTLSLTATHPEHLQDLSLGLNVE